MGAYHSASALVGSRPSALHAVAASYLLLRESKVRKGAPAELGEDGLLSSRKRSTIALLVWVSCHQTTGMICSGLLQASSCPRAYSAQRQAQPSLRTPSVGKRTRAGGGCRLLGLPTKSRILDPCVMPRTEVTGTPTDGNRTTIDMNAAAERGGRLLSLSFTHTHVHAHETRTCLRVIACCSFVLLPFFFRSRLLCVPQSGTSQNVTAYTHTRDHATVYSGFAQSQGTTG